jgi:pescadillo protein
VTAVLKKQTDEEKKLSELMMPKKNKRLYNKILYSKKKEKQEADKLKQKRQAHDAANNKVKHHKTN